MGLWEAVRACCVTLEHQSGVTWTSGRAVGFRFHWHCESIDTWLAPRHQAAPASRALTAGRGFSRRRQRRCRVLVACCIYLCIHKFKFDGRISFAVAYSLKYYSCCVPFCSSRLRFLLHTLSPLVTTFSLPFHHRYQAPQ